MQLIILALTAFSFAALKMVDLPWALLAFAVLGVLYNLGRVAVEVAGFNQAFHNGGPWDGQKALCTVPGCCSVWSFSESGQCFPVEYTPLQYFWYSPGLSL